MGRQFGTMADKLADYEKLLRDLNQRVSESDAQLIKAVLEKVTPNGCKEEQS